MLQQEGEEESSERERKDMNGKQEIQTGATAVAVAAPTPADLSTSAASVSSSSAPRAVRFQVASRGAWMGAWRSSVRSLMDSIGITALLALLSLVALVLDDLRVWLAPPAADASIHAISQRRTQTESRRAGEGRLRGESYAL